MHQVGSLKILCQEVPDGLVVSIGSLLARWHTIVLIMGIMGAFGVTLVLWHAGPVRTFVLMSICCFGVVELLPSALRTEELRVEDGVLRASWRIGPVVRRVSVPVSEVLSIEWRDRARRGGKQVAIGTKSGVIATCRGYSKAEVETALLILRRTMSLEAGASARAR
jgi:hypothetical protein